MYSLALIIFVVSEKKAFEYFPIGSNVNLCISVAAILNFRSPYGKNVSKCFFSETTWTIETKLPRNDHWKVLYNVSVFYADRKSKTAATWLSHYKPEALQSLHHSPGNKKNQLVLCKNYVMQW
jgi:hypothetical protein